MEGEIMRSSTVWIVMAVAGAGATLACADRAQAYIVTATYFNVDEVSLMAADGSGLITATDTDNDGRIDLDISSLTPTAGAYPGPYTKIKIKSTGRMGYVCHLVNAVPTQTSPSGGPLMPVLIGEDDSGRPVSGVTQFDLSAYGAFADPGLSIGSVVTLSGGHINSGDPYGFMDGSPFMSVLDLVNASAAGPLPMLNGTLEVGALFQYTIVPTPGAAGALALAGVAAMGRRSRRDAR